MAKLTEEQKQAVAQWATEGATLNDIQSRLKESFGIVLTYFDTRLLVMELEIKLVDKKKEAEIAAAAAPPADLPRSPSGEAPEALDDEWMSPDAPAGGQVSVTLDELAIPGTMVSGKVTFSDGKRVPWFLDNHGRLSLRPEDPAYQPPPADIPAFQQQLQQLLR